MIEFCFCWLLREWIDGISQIYNKYGHIEVLSLSIQRSFQKYFSHSMVPGGGHLCHTDTFLDFDLTINCFSRHSSQHCFSYVGRFPGLNRKKLKCLAQAGFAQAWKVLEFRGLSWKVLENLNLPWKVLDIHSKALKSPWILFFSVGLNTVDRDLNQYKLLCLYLVQQMLHQIKAQQFHTHFLVLISPLSQSSFFEEEFYHFDQYFF